MQIDLCIFGGTSNTLNHLKLKHFTLFSETPEKMKQSMVSDIVNLTRSRRFSSSQYEVIANVIVDTAVLDY